MVYKQSPAYRYSYKHQTMYLEHVAVSYQQPQQQVLGLYWLMSWRAPFYIIGVPIIIIGLVMLWIIKDKPKAQPATENGVKLSTNIYH